MMKNVTLKSYSERGTLTLRSKQVQDFGSHISLNKGDELSIGNFGGRSTLIYKGLDRGTLSFLMKKERLGIPSERRTKHFGIGQSFYVLDNQFVVSGLESEKVILNHQSH